MNPLAEQLLRTFDNQDAFTSMEELARHDDTMAALRAVVEVMREFYWKRKDLNGSVLAANAGIAVGSFAAARVEPSDAAQALQLRGIVKGLAYDIASFTWPGWDESGITVSPVDQRMGLEAAKANLRLAHELNKGDLPLSRAHWMLAGHLLFLNRHAEATEHYRSAADFAKKAGSAADERLCRAFAAIATIALNNSDAVARAELDAAQRELATLGKEGEMFVSQITTVRRLLRVGGT